MRTVKSYLFLIFGSLCTAISVNTFAVPNHLGEGGVPGLTMLGYYLFHIPTSVSNLILNGLLVLIGLNILEKETIVKTLFVIFVNSIWLHLLEPYPYLFKDGFIAPLVAGFFMGLGIGIIYLGGGTAAGGTIVAKMLQVKTGLAKSKGILITDLSVILPSVFVIGFEQMCLTVISVYIGSKVIAFISEGGTPKKSILIISPNVSILSKKLEQTIQRNGTFLTGIGSYSNKKQEILYIIIESTELLALKKTIQQIDPQAFVVVSDIQNVLGQRFERSF